MLNVESQALRPPSAKKNDGVEPEPNAIISAVSLLPDASNKSTFWSLLLYNAYHVPSET